MGKAVLVPFYVALNVTAVLLFGIVRDSQNVVGVALPARKGLRPRNG
jgi:hypothetical protein